jgi:aminobenzoyl-glutamate utilization protein B
MRFKPLWMLAGWVLVGSSAAAAADGGATAATSARKGLAFQVVERNVGALADIGDSIFYFGELGMQEVESTRLLADTLSAAGFKVERGGAGMPTALWAEWGTGRPRIAVVTEIDALPGGSQTPGSLERKPLVIGAPGHMEGHNTQGGVATVAAFAVKEVMQRYHIPGSVAVSFGPAEEQLISRPFLVRAGQFKEVDDIIIIHIGSVLATGYGLANYAQIGANVTFHGKGAHGSADPWDGKNALDAVELMDAGLAMLREQLRPTARVGRSITLGGVSPSIIPDLAKSAWVVHDATMPFAKEDFDKLVHVAEGAALMTGTTQEMALSTAAWPQLANKTLAATIQSNIAKVGMPQWTGAENDFAKALQHEVGQPEVGLSTEPTPLGARPQSASSNDNGDVTWTVPAGSLNFPAAVSGVSFHEWHAAITPTSSIAHKGMTAGAKVLAASILDLLTSASLRAAIRAEFEAETRATPYVSPLPADAKPPLDLNAAVMDRYRAEMRKYYLGKTPRLQ